MLSVARKRGWSKSYITCSLAYAQKLPQELLVENLQNRLRKLESAYSDLVEYTQQLYDFQDEENFVDPQEDFEKYEEKYFEAHAIFNKAINEKLNLEVSKEDEVSPIEKLATQQAEFLAKLNMSNKDNSSVHLATLSIPTFSGNYQDWPSFKDLFQGAIDCKKGSTSTQKLYYLKSYLGCDSTYCSHR